MKTQEGRDDDDDDDDDYRHHHSHKIFSLWLFLVMMVARGKLNWISDRLFVFNYREQPPIRGHQVGLETMYLRQNVVWECDFHRYLFHYPSH